MIRPESFSGSAFSVGQSRARTLGVLPMPEAGAADIAFARDCKEIVGELAPPLIQLYEGFVDAGDWDQDRFLVYFFARRQGILRGCTNFAVLPEVSADDTTLVGRNYDWAYSDLAYCEAREVRIDGAIPYVSYTHHWAGHPDCLNGEGLFVAISSLPRGEAVVPGVQWNLLVDAIAMTCTTVGEAVDLLTGVRHLRAITYLVADRATAAAVEATASGTTVRYPVDGLVAATNHVVGQSDATDRTRHSVARYDRALSRLRECASDITESQVASVLKDPVCTIRDGKRFLHPLDHVPLAALENWGTIWSTICRPGERKIKVAQGHPLDTEYEDITWQPGT